MQNIKTNYIHDIINDRGFKRIAEVGVYRGDHAAEFLRLCELEKLILVDPWAEYESIGQAETKDLKLLHERKAGWDKIAAEVLARFNGNLITEIIREKSTDAVRRIPDQSLDVVYIDADHTYAPLMADIKAWLPKIRPGGVISGHDYDAGWPDVIKAVNDSFGNRVIQLDGHQWMVNL